MKTKLNVVVLGKGSLAIKVANWFKEKHSLVCIVPELPEPGWTESITNWASLNQVMVIESGNHEDIPENFVINLAVSVFYGKIIKDSFIGRCEEIINLHNSPLPKYRGVRPINWALKNNEEYHGFTIHKITPGIDEGPILGIVKYPVYPDIEEVEDVYEKALQYGWLLFTDVMSKFDYIAKNARPQTGEASYYTLKDVDRLGDRKAIRRNVS